MRPFKPAGIGSLRRLLPLPLLIPWTILVAPAGYLVGRVLYEETYLTWVGGPQMVGFALVHSGSGAVLMLSALLMALWVLATGAWIIVRLLRHEPVIRSNYLVPGLTAGCLLLLFIPEAPLREGMVAAFGPGPHANDLLVNAAATKQLGLVKMLLARGIDIDSRSEGSTALSGAAVEGDSAIVTFLLARGARVNMPGDNGSKALAGALDMQHSGLARLLLTRGAEPVCYAKELAALEATIAARDTALNVIFARDDSLQESGLKRDAHLQDSLLAQLHLRERPCSTHGIASRVLRRTRLGGSPITREGLS